MNIIQEHIEHGSWEIKSSGDIDFMSLIYFFGCAGSWIIYISEVDISLLTATSFLSACFWDVLKNSCKTTIIFMELNTKNETESEECDTDSIY